MSATARNQVFSAVHTVGGLLPADVLIRISEGRDVTGASLTSSASPASSASLTSFVSLASPASYGVVGGRSVCDEAERSWAHLKAVWRELRERLPEDAASGAPAHDLAGLAAGQWPAPLFGELGFGDLTAVGPAGIDADDGTKTFPVSHRRGHVPIHIAPWNADLDGRTRGMGERSPGGVPPQSLVQECLNRTVAHLWGVLTNGRQLRLLRDSSAPATSSHVSYVEFDLEAIFDGELFSEFALLYRLLHVSRFESGQDGAPALCPLERWRTDAIASGTRALDQLRKGVQEAITTLGTGFLRHPDNARLRENVDTGALHTALLRLVYRLLFVFVAEARGALHAPGADERARGRYAKCFSTTRLRERARRGGGSPHGDLYQDLRIVLDALGDERGRPELGLPGLGGLFDRTDADAPLFDLSLSDEYLLAAVRHLSEVRDVESRGLRSVDYRHLAAEELGSLYESLLELVPRRSAADRGFELVDLAGNTRKMTGSYYTPSSLIECLLDSTLDPVLDDAVKRGELAASEAGRADPAAVVAEELLSLTVCDPACGSGHFLVAAARRIAKRVAAVRERTPEPTLDAVRHALHEVVARCVYGVDLNPMAVELAKVSLWLEALEPGRPLGFLDAHIKHGNGLIGTTPALLRAGIPDEAFRPIEGDDKHVARALAKRNAAERSGRRDLFAQEATGEVADTDEVANTANTANTVNSAANAAASAITANATDPANVADTAVADGLLRIASASSGTLGEVRRQKSAYRDWETSGEYAGAAHLADAWCAAFVWRKTASAPLAVTHEVFRALENSDATAAPPETHEEIVRLRDQYRFFHWHLEFPEVFENSEAPGFSCLLGNPPWERVKLQEQEFFAQRDAKIAEARDNGARKALIAALKQDPARRALYEEFETAKREAEGVSHFLRNAGRHPLTGRGDINTYAVFSETGRALTGKRGRTGVIVPTGVATDATTQFFFKSLVEGGAISALYDFENSAPLFVGVHRSFKFSILSLVGTALREPAARFAFFLRDTSELGDTEKVFTLTPDEIALLNPNTGTCPVFRSRRDADIALAAQRHGRILRAVGSEAPALGVRMRRVYDLGKPRGVALCEHVSAVNGARLSGPRMYEGKLLHAFDHRFASYDPTGGEARELTDRGPDSLVRPRYHLASARKLDEDLAGWTRPWLLCFRDVARTTDERTVIAAAVPRVATDYTVRVMFAEDPAPWLLLANLNSFVFDFLYRLRLGGTHLSDFITYQLPAIAPETYVARTLEGVPASEWIAARVLELTYTAHDMAPFARDLGDAGGLLEGDTPIEGDGPFAWDEERRAVLRAELDALYFHLYGIPREDAAYILDTFPIVRRKSEARYGTYRTKELILDAYDRMSPGASEPFTSALDPPPGRGSRLPTAEVTTSGGG